MKLNPPGAQCHVTRVPLREAERLRKKYTLSWFPSFTNLGFLQFFEKQVQVLD